jgi:hypothetical protein
MGDVLYFAVVIAFFALMIGLIGLSGRITGDGDREAPLAAEPRLDGERNDSGGTQPQSVR